MLANGEDMLWIVQKSRIEWIVEQLDLARPLWFVIMMILFGMKYKLL